MDGDAEARLTETAAGFDLVIVDSLTAFSGNLDEDKKGIGRACYMFARASEATKATFIVLHHVTKGLPEDTRGGAKMRIRGSGSIPGAAGNIFVLSSLGKSKPAKVEHERPLFGRTIDDFGIRIVDVIVDGDPRGGLRVEHLQREQLTSTEDREADGVRERAIAKLREKIVECVRKHGPVRGNDALRGLVGGRHEMVKAALSELLAGGDICNRGSDARPKYVQGTPGESSEAFQ